MYVVMSNRIPEQILQGKGNLSAFTHSEVAGTHGQNAFSHTRSLTSHYTVV